jgi:serine/threonine protein kinase
MLYQKSAALLPTKPKETLYQEFYHSPKSVPLVFLMDFSRQTPLSTPPVPDWLRELGWEEVYEVRRLIARGGMGRVYEGWHRTLGIPVALKIIDPHLTGEDHIRARFEKDSMTLARLQEPVPHPNIVRVIDFKLLEDPAIK